MGFVRRTIISGVVFLILFILAACGADIGDADDSLIVTSVYLEGGNLHVKYLDDSTKDLGPIEKDLDEGSDESGIIKVAFNESGQFIVEYSDGTTDNVGFLIGTVGTPVALTVTQSHIRWRFNENDDWNDLIPMSILTSEDLRKNFDVSFRIEGNEIKWKDIDDNDWSTFTNILFLQAMFGGGSSYTITSVTINENNQTVITLDDGKTFVLDILVESYTVTFLDHDDMVLKIETVARGFSANAPSPTKEGFELIGWDIDVSNVLSDLTVRPIFSAIEYYLIFDYDGIDNMVVNYNIEVGVLPIPVKEGQTFIKWVDSNGLEYNANTIFTSISDVTLTPIFDVSTTSTYQVSYYKENRNNPGVYDGYKHPVIEAPIGTLITVDDFHDELSYVLEPNLSELTGTVKADNSLHLHVYLKIERFTAVFHNLEGEVINTMVFMWGESVAYPPAPSKEGYNFGGWIIDSDPEKPVSGAYLVYENLMLYPTYTPVDVIYTVRHHLEQTSGEYVTTTKQLAAPAFSDVNVLPNEYDGYSYNPSLSTYFGNVGLGNFLFLDLYYDLIDYEIKFYVDDQVVYYETVHYDDHLILANLLADPVKEDYLFLGWMYNDLVVTTYKVKGSINLYASFKLDDANYTVIHYYKSDVSGNYLINTSTVYRGIVGKEVIAELDDTVPEYVTFNADMSNISGIVRSDGSLVLNVYYSYKMREVIYMVNGEIFNTEYFEHKSFVFIGAELPNVENGTFLGWVLDVENDFPVMGMSFTISSDLIVYGIIEADRYAIHYIDGFNQEIVNVLWNDEVNLLNVTTDNYDFLGWYTADDEFHPTNFIYTYEEDLYLYARWDFLLGINYSYTQWEYIVMPDFEAPNGNVGEYVILTNYFGKEEWLYMPYVVTHEGRQIFVGAVDTGALTGNPYVRRLMLMGSVHYLPYSINNMPNLKIVETYMNSGTLKFYEGSFMDNTALEYVNLSNSSQSYFYNTELDSGGIFENAINLVEFIWPQRMDKIANRMFYGAMNLETLTYSVIDIPGHALDGTLQNEYTYIGYKAFEGTTSLKSFVVLDYVTQIGDYAFKNSGLESVVLSNSLHTISKQAFYNTKLTEVSIPKSVGLIDEEAFYELNNLEIITFNGTSASGGYIRYHAFGSPSNNVLKYVIITQNFEHLGEEIIVTKNPIKIYTERNRLYMGNANINWASPHNSYFANEWEYDGNGKPQPILN